MELGDFTESLGFGSFSVGALLDKLWYYFSIFILILVIAGIIGIFYYFFKKKKDPKETKKIGWWEEVGETLSPGKMEDAEEIVIPGTILRVFYVKAKDLWLPRFSRGITNSLYYVLRTPTGQLINFTLKSISSDLKEAKLDYDHTDMLWAAENTREFIKRNFKDKNIKWWQAYQGVITTGAYLMMMTFSFIMIIYFLRGVIQDIGAIASQLGNILEKMNAASQTSGVVKA